MFISIYKKQAIRAQRQAAVYWEIVQEELAAGRPEQAKYFQSRAYFCNSAALDNLIAMKQTEDLEAGRPVSIY